MADPKVGDAPLGGLDEFGEIARLFRPLTMGSPEALGLKDDVAVLPSRPGFDLVLTKDAMVAGVHFLPDEPLDLVARKLLRVNLSDLAAKGAQPHGYLLAVAWQPSVDLAGREAFVAGLAQDQEVFGVRLLGGDTVSTPGPLTLSLTLLGWTPEGVLVGRSGARAGDVVLVSGTLGDAGLGLRALTEGLPDASAVDLAYLTERHRLPTPRLSMREALRGYASAACDVSDGLLADAGHIAEASGLAMAIRLENVPLSSAAANWLARQPDEAAARLVLATAGDDYEIVCTAAPQDAPALIAAAAEASVPLASIGEVVGSGPPSVSLRGEPVEVGRRGWTHG